MRPKWVVEPCADSRLTPRVAPPLPRGTHPLTRTAPAAKQVVAIALSITKLSHNRNWDPVAKKPRKPYIKLPLWWLGIVLTAGGEVGNLVAYGFAPAAVVAPGAAQCPYYGA